MMDSKLGLVLYHGFETGAELARYAEVAEREGYDSLWMTERSGHEEAFATLGYAAAATGRLRLGLGVANAYSRHPVLLAMASATLDRLSGGRFILGLGASDRDVVEGKLGIPHERPIAELERTVRSLRALFAGETVDDEAGRSKIRGVRLGVHPVAEPLPLYVAAAGPKALAMAGRVADGLILNTYSPTSYVRWAVATARRSAEESGRDPASLDVVCMLVVRLTDDPASLYPMFKERVARLLSEPHGGELLLKDSDFDPALAGRVREAASDGGPKAAAGLIPEAMVEQFYVLGDAARCKERIEEYREAGVDEPLLLPRLEDFEAVASAFAG